MSSVTPSDGGYYSYARSVSDLEDEKNAEIKKAKAREDARVARLEDAQKQELEKREAAMTDAVARARESVRGDVEREKRASREEIERIKAQTYDRFGRYNGLEADEMKEQLRSTLAATELERDHSKKQMAATERLADERSDERAQKYSREAETAVARARDAAVQAFEQNAREAGDKFETYKEDLRQKNQVAEEARIADRRFFEKMASKAQTDAEHEISHRVAVADETVEQRVAKAVDETNVRSARAAADQQISREKENADLRATIGRFTSSDKDYARGESEGRVFAAKEMENEFRAQRANDRFAAENEIAGLHRRSEDSEAAMARKSSQTLAEHDRSFAGITQRQSQDAQDEKVRMRNDMARERSTVAAQNKREVEGTRQGYERQLDKQREVFVEAMDKTRAASEETLHRQKDSDAQEKEVVDKKLDKILTSTGSAEIPSTIVEGIRSQAEADFHKKMLAEQTRNLAAFDRAYKNSNDLLQDEMRKNTASQAQIRRGYETQRQADQAAYANHIADTEFLKQDAIAKKDRENLDSSEVLQREYAKSLETQRRDSTEQVEATRFHNEDKLTAQRAELEFNLRSAQRTSAARQNELIRDFEKKLSDQKAELTAQNEDAKAQSEKTLRDREREHKRELSDQARMYDQRIALVESQAKERERILNRNHEEELEKTRRSNALSASKKS